MKILVTGGAGFTPIALLTGQGTASSTPSVSATGRAETDTFIPKFREAL
ncbi:MAG: hypothetical protein CEN89_498 [Candidatus Berkelbacteria bacterium Licking1014_7]|uniref:Uncharacterized protein n=1 Tax=Candidatus Berkelbacteria bacterium Licking1014_7 TaxID=2017147 RepID=A0A554LIM7_9BACT|nr:MAG: hypothetical protein CEN89_498 [Candidatus Berkelbacteria bacterium Licking1014_7]